MAVIVVGSGELAVRLITSLESRGDEVILITPHVRDAEEFALEFPRTMVLSGDARDPAVLTQAQAARADRLIAATGDDAENLSICLLAREAFHLAMVAGLAGHAHNVRLFHALGIPCISCSEIVADGVMAALGERPIAVTR